MKKLIIILASLFTFGLAIGAASAQTVAPLQGWCELGGQKVLTSGSSSSTFVQASYPKCQVEVFLTGTHNHPAQIYSNSGLTPLANPFIAQTNGSWLLYSTTGVGVDIVLSGGTPNSFPAPYTLVDQSLGGGGGGGGGVSQILAGSNITISPTNGLGAVTINSPGGGGGGSFEWLNTDTFITNPPGNNGIANAIASSNCTPNGCTAIQPAESTSTEVQNTLILPVFQFSPIGLNWPDGTHFVDTTHGQTTDFWINPFTATYLGGVTLPPAAGQGGAVTFSECNPNQLNGASLIFPTCGYDYKQFASLSGGHNEFVAGIPSFKTNYQAFSTYSGMFTEGQFITNADVVTCAGFGDCLFDGTVQAHISGGSGENADEGAHGRSVQAFEFNGAMLFKCTAGCGTGVSSFTFSPVPGLQNLAIGDGMYIQDIQSPVTSQSLGIHISNAREQAAPLSYFTMSGNLPADSWMAMSATPEMCGTTATSAASPGTNVSIPVTYSGACLAGGQVIIRGSPSVLNTIQSVPDSTHIVIASLTTSVGNGTAIAAAPIGAAGTVTVTIQTPAAWNSGTTYSLNQVVTSGGQQYISGINNNINNAPASSPNQWQTVFGIQSSTSSLGASGIACVADGTQTFTTDYAETVPWTKTGATTLSMTFQKPHPNIIMIGIGGQCQHQMYPNAHLYGNLADGAVGQANSILGNFGPIVYIYDHAGTRAISVNSNGESEIAYINAASTAVARTSNRVSITTNTNWGLSGHTLTISGCTDPTYNATAVATSTGNNSFSYANTGSNGSTTGCTVVDDNAEFTIVPAIKIAQIMNPATKSIDGTIGALYPNSIAINNTDQLLAPHFGNMNIQAGATDSILSQIIPRNDFCSLNTAGQGTLNFDGRPGPCMAGAFVSNSANPSIYMGLGGYKNPPAAAGGSSGVFQWNYVASDAGLSGFAQVGCKPTGCTGWNAPYPLFDLESAGVDSLMIYHPDTNLLDFFNAGSPATLQLQNLIVRGTASLPNLIFTQAITVPGIGGPAPFNGQCCNIVFSDGLGTNLPLSAIGALSSFKQGPVSIGPQCNPGNGNSFNCNTPSQYGLYAAYFTSNFSSTFNGISSGLPLPFFQPHATAATSGTLQYGYVIEACVDSSLVLCTPFGDPGNSILTATINSTNTVTVAVPAALQNGMVSGNVYKLVRSDQGGGGGTINLGVITLGVPFVDNGSITTPEVISTVNYTAPIGAGWIIDKEMASNSGNCAQYTTGGRLASSGSPCGSGGGGGVTSIGGNGGAFTCTGSVTCTGTVINGAAAGTGTVTSFSSGNLSPLFTTSVATSTTTPALTYTLSTVAQNSVFAGPASGGAGVPSFQTAPTISATNMISFPTLNQNTTGTAAAWTTARLLAGNSVNGSGNVPFANKFIVQGTSDAGLSGAQFLGALGSGLLKNTTSTGVLSIAFSSDVISLWTGTCSSSTFLRGDGACAAGVGGTVTTSGSPTTGFLPLFTASTVIGNSHMDDGISLAGAITVSEQFNVNNPSQPSGIQISPNTHNTFSGIGACNSGSEGILTYITDSSVNTWGSNAAGGGSIHVGVSCNGSAWTVFSK